MFLPKTRPSPRRLARAVALVLCCATPLATYARRPSEGDRNPPSTRPAPGGSEAFFGEPSAEEWVEVKDFMEKNSPNRFASYDRMKEGEAKTRFRGRLFGMYKRLQWVRRDQPMYDVKLQQVKIDDDIYSISRELRRAGSDDDRRTFLEGQLQASVSKLVDAQAAERKLRLERLQQEVQRLQQQVDGEKSLRDEAIRQAMDRARKGWSPTSRPLGPDKDRDRGPDHQRGSDRGRDRDADAEGNDDRAHAPEESR